MASNNIINLPSLLLAGVASGGWVFISGLLMAGAFGYRDMKAAFDSIGLPVNTGVEPFVVHTVVRFLTGITVVVLFAIMLRIFSPLQALCIAAGVTWLLGALLPFAVIVEWGLFPWSLALKIWAWSAGELLIAAAIGKWLYSP